MSACPVILFVYYTSIWRMEICHKLYSVNQVLFSGGW